MADEKQPEKAPDRAPLPRLHSFVEITGGSYTGLIGSFEKREGRQGLYALVRTRDHKTGFPAFVSVPVSDIKQSDYTGGR